MCRTKKLCNMRNVLISHQNSSFISPSLPENVRDMKCAATMPIARFIQTATSEGCVSLDSSVSTLTRLKARRPKYRGSIPGWGKRNVSSLMHTAGSGTRGRQAGPEAHHSAIQCRYYFCMTLFKLHKRNPPTSSVYLLPQNWSLSQPDRRVCTNTVRHCTSAINDTVHDFTKRHYQMATLFSFTLFYNENQNDVVWLAFKWSALYQLSLRCSTWDETEGRGENRTIVRISQRVKAFPKFFKSEGGSKGVQWYVDTYPQTHMESNSLWRPQVFQHVLWFKITPT